MSALATWQTVTTHGHGVRLEIRIPSDWSYDIDEPEVRARTGVSRGPLVLRARESWDYKSGAFLCICLLEDRAETNTTELGMNMFVRSPLRVRLITLRYRPKIRRLEKFGSNEWFYTHYRHHGRCSWHSVTVTPNSQPLELTFTGPITRRDELTCVFTEIISSIIFL